MLGILTRILASSSIIRGLARWRGGKIHPANAGDTGDMGLLLGSELSPGLGSGNPLDILAWRIPRTEESGGYI